MEVKPKFQQPANFITVKVGLNEDLRRFSFSGDFAALHKEIADAFHQALASVTLTYKDDEGDCITLASDRDLTEAKKVLGPILRLTVVLSKTVLLVTPSVPAPDIVRSEERSEEEKDAKHKEKKKEKEERRAKKVAFKAQLRQEKYQERVLKREAWDPEKSPKEKKLQARFVKDVTIEDGSELFPGASFVKTWRFRNEGTRAWPAGSKLIFVSKLKGDIMGGSEEVAAPIADPGAEVDVSVQLTAPQEPGRYVGYWRLAAPDGTKFGQRVRVLIYVAASSSESDAVRSAFRAVARKIPKNKEGNASAEVDWAAMLEQLKQMGFENQKRNLKLLQKFDGNISAVVNKLAHHQHKYKKQNDTLKKASDDM